MLQVRARLYEHVRQALPRAQCRAELNKVRMLDKADRALAEEARPGEEPVDVVRPDCVLEDQAEHVLRRQAGDERLELVDTLLVLRGLFRRCLRSFAS